MQLVTPTLGDLEYMMAGQSGCFRLGFVGAAAGYLSMFIPHRGTAATGKATTAVFAAFWASEIFIYRVRSHGATLWTADACGMVCQLVDETMTSPVVYNVFEMHTLYSISGTGPGASSRVAHAHPCTSTHPYPFMDANKFPKHV